MVFVNNTNIRRKQLLLTLDAFDKFCSNLKLTDANSVALLIHTNPTNTFGSNLHTLVDQLYPNRNIIFSNQVVSDETLNQMYNSSDVTINLASNEGFGLATLEALSTETPIIVNKTGGLSEQIDEDNTWGIGIKPKVRNLIGSPNVPYIYDDICCADEVAAAINTLYEKSYAERKHMGSLGRKFVISNGYTLEDMCTGVYTGISTAMETHTPRESFKCIKVV
jgi:glycosyltransferase involved in cell wall biosynthesis